MPLRMSISVTGIRETRAELRKVAMELGNHNEFLKDYVEPALRNTFRYAFQSHGYRRWQPLAASTVRSKTRQGYPATPLVRTGRYRRSATKLEGLRIRPNVIEVDSPIRYAGYLEYGTRNMPARPVFSTVTERIRRRLPELYRKYARERLLNGLPS